MNNRIQINKNKTLRLDNVLVKDIVRINSTTDEIDSVVDEQLAAIVEKMKNEIISKGAMQIGPLIHYSCSGEESDDVGIRISLMLQADRHIKNVNYPYRMEPVILCKNCMYTRFIGSEEDIHFAYQKMEVTAYEEGIRLKGSSYTIYLESDEFGTITADIFMERADA